MIDQEQAARTLINLIDVVHQENWVLLNKEDMASKTEEYYINFFKEHHLEDYFKYADGFEMVTTNCLTGKAMYLSENHDRQRAFAVSVIITWDIFHGISRQR